MKNIFFLLGVLAVLFLTSCSNNIDVIADDGSTIPTTFFPIANGNWWTYKVQTQLPHFLRDSLYVKGDTLIDGIIFKKMKTKFAPNGFYTAILRNNGVRIKGSSLKLSGSIAISTGLPSPIVFSVADFTFFKENGIQNEVIGTSSGTFQQTIQGYPLTFAYTLNSYFDGSVASFTTTTNKSYTDIKKTKVVLNLKITYTLPGIGLTATLLQPQDVVVSTQYYAKNKGMVYATTDINYILSSIPGLTLPIPSSGSQNQKEFLDTLMTN